MNLNYKKKRLYLFLSVRISFSSKVSLRLYLETERWTFLGIANFNLFTWPLTLSKKIFTFQKSTKRFLKMIAVFLLVLRIMVSKYSGKNQVSFVSFCLHNFIIYYYFIITTKVDKLLIFFRLISNSYNSG